MPPEVAAAWITVGGIVITAAITAAVTMYIAHKQRQSERQKHLADTALEIKKEILIQAVKGCNEMLDSIGTFLNTTRTLIDQTKMFQEGVSKMIVAEAVASWDVIEAGDRLILGAGPKVFGLMPTRVRLDELQHQLNAGLQIREETRVESAQLLEQQQLALIKKDLDLFDSIKIAYDGKLKLMSVMDRDNEERRKNLDAERAKTISDPVRARSELDQLRAAYISAVRKDIQADKPGDDTYLKVKTANPEKREELLRSLRKTVREIAGGDR